MSLTELLVSCGVLGMVMAAVGGVVATSGKISTDGDNRAQAQQAARAGMMMEEDLRLAGSGFPPSVAKITEATSTSVAFWADLGGGRTTPSSNATPHDPSVTAPDPSGQR